MRQKRVASILWLVAALGCGDSSDQAPAAASGAGGSAGQGGGGQGGEGPQAGAGGDAAGEGGSAGDSGSAGLGGAGQGGAGGAAGDGASALWFEGDATLDQVEPEGTEHFSVDLELQNQSDQPLKLTHGRFFAVNQGGFAFDLGDEVAANGSFYGVGPSLSASDKLHKLPLGFVWSTPLTHVVYRVEAQGSDGATVSSRLAVPLLRQGFEPPAASPFDDDTVITLQEPVEALDLASGERWLTLVGQVANLTAQTLSVDSLSLELRVGGEVALTGDVHKHLETTSTKAPLKDFVFTAALPAGFSGGDLSLVAKGKLGKVERTIEREAKVTLGEATTLLPPVKGRWRWGNGQGETVYHTHFRYPEQRYAYDILVEKDGATFSGDPAVNESYYAFGQPVLAAADGTVAAVVDDVPDNLGNQPSPDNDPVRNAFILIDHGQQRFTLYAHVRKGSAKVKEGQAVKAGDALAEVGNAGFSSEPHLHFAHFAIDPTGRVRALPMRFDTLKDTAGKVSPGTPHGGVEYESE